MGQGREKGGWPLHTDVLELQPCQSWRLVIEDRGGKGVLGVVVRDLEHERLQNRSMDRRVEDLENIGSQLTLLRTKVELAVTVRRIGESRRELGQRSGEGLTDGKRGSFRAVNEHPGTVRLGHVDLAPETTMLESNVTPETTDVGEGDPLEIDLETVLSLKLLGQIKEDFGQDLRG